MVESAHSPSSVSTNSREGDVDADVDLGGQRELVPMGLGEKPEVPFSVNTLREYATVEEEGYEFKNFKYFHSKFECHHHSLSNQSLTMLTT